MKNTQWGTFVFQPGMIHVMPINDRREHTGDQKCWCLPRTHYYSKGAVVVHQSADLREVVEWACEQVRFNTPT